jgi:GH25 family lysozyme M1 (1,4-beta-N-acetylmuramidase)
MRGIDISAWQEHIDWQAVKDSGIGFVIIKLGEHGRLDSKFIDHVNNAVAYGLRYGVYFYAHATSVEEARAEADWVGTKIQTYLNGKNPEMGIWYDMEDSAIADSGADITALCGNFVDQLNQLGYNYVGVYSSYNWLTNGNIDTSRLADYMPYWCAQYNRECNFEHPNLRMWQYTDSQYIAGDYFDGDIYYE